MNKTTFTYITGLTTNDGYHRQYKHEGTGMIKELFTGRKNGQPTDEIEELFYHPKDKQTHNNFMDALKSADNLGLIKCNLSFITN